MIVSVNNVETEMEPTATDSCGYRWFVRMAGMDPMANPRPTVIWTLPDGQTGETKWMERAPIAEGAKYTVSA